MPWYTIASLSTITGPFHKGTVVFSHDAGSPPRARLLLRIKLRRTHCEQMSSGWPLKADLAQCSRHFAFVPTGDSCTAANNIATGPARRRDVLMVTTML